MLRYCTLSENSEPVSAMARRNCESSTALLESWFQRGFSLATRALRFVLLRYLGAESDSYWLTPAAEAHATGQQIIICCDFPWIGPKHSKFT